MKNLWKEAVKRNLKVELPTGHFIGLHQLWELPMEGEERSLDAVYQHYGLKIEPAKYSLSDKKKTDTDAEIIMALVKEVYEDKQKEQEEAKKKKELMERLALLKEIKAEKEISKLKSSSMKKLEEEIASLEAELNS